MSDREAILFANEAFYAAFGGRDFAAMEAVWAQTDITCVHPGWPPLRGRTAVMSSWRNILGNPDSPAAEVRQADVVMHGTTAIVTCIELLPGDRPHTLCATNIFVKESGGWKLIHHQAGEANVDPRTLTEEDRPPVN
jgi:ketosteroid isomerase-like protein